MPNKRNVISPYTKRETGVIAPTTGAFLSSTSQEKYMPSALENML